MTATPLPPSALDKMAFLAGHWRGDLDGGAIEEMWLPPSAGVAQATVRLVRDGEVKTIELIVVAAEKDRVVMRFNHFRPDYGVEESDGPIELTLTRARDGEVVFDNLSSPPRHAAEMGYRSDGPDRMTSWIVTLEGPGAPERLSFDYRKVA
jgi:hypothetical protein